MSGIQYGYVQRPGYQANYLLATVGYVTSLCTEQEGDYDQIRFVLRVHSEWVSASPTIAEPRFSILGNRSSPVAYASAQLLRKALFDLHGQALVHVHFSFESARHDAGWPYLVRLVYTPTYPVTPQSYFGFSNTSVIENRWWYHEEG